MLLRLITRKQAILKTHITRKYSHKSDRDFLFHLTSNKASIMEYIELHVISNEHPHSQASSDSKPQKKKSKRYKLHFQHNGQASDGETE